MGKICLRLGKIFVNICKTLADLGKLRQVFLAFALAQILAQILDMSKQARKKIWILMANSTQSFKY